MKPELVAHPATGLCKKHTENTAYGDERNATSRKTFEPKPEDIYALKKQHSAVAHTPSLGRSRTKPQSDRSPTSSEYLRTRVPTAAMNLAISDLKKQVTALEALAETLISTESTLHQGRKSLSEEMRLTITEQNKLIRHSVRKILNQLDSDHNL